MSVEAGVEARRPRPVSAGLWTLFSWLRRDERSSTESVSSAGSDRTVASFAFISPAHYRPGARAGPTALPPLGPPTDTYNKRIHERNLRLQREHDLTLHRKYGLLKGDSTSRYNTFSSPSARTGKGEAYDILNRERRASSESGQRRSAYVAGKRRAPPPPVYAAATSSLNRRTRKRPAPQPPMNNNDAKLKNLMTSKSASGTKNLENTDNCLDCKSEKYSKADVSKECKSRNEKNFLKQIFEGKKGKSTVVSALGRLPNISELDREAAEIIRMRRDYSALNSNSMFKGDSWFCTTCLRKYDPSIVSCLHCVQDVKFTNKTKEKNESSNVPSTSIQENDRQQLKKMLKEMKDSIPKKSKLNDYESRNEKKVVDQQNTNFIGSDTPTLQMQWSMKANDEKKSVSKQLFPKTRRVSENSNVNFINNNILVTQTVVIQSPPNNISEINSKRPTFNDSPRIVTLLEDNVRAPDTSKDTNFGERDCERKFVNDTKQMNSTHLNSTMRISSLLNPVSIPRSNDKDKKNCNYSQNYVIKETEPINRDVKNVEDKRPNIADILQTNYNIKNKTALNTSLLDNLQNHVFNETVSINKDVINVENKVHTANNLQSNPKVIKEIESNRDVMNVDKTVNTVDVSQFNDSDLENKIILKTSLQSNPQNHIIKENNSINRDVKNVEKTINIAQVSQTNSGLRNQIILEKSKNHVGTGSINKDVKDIADVSQANSNTRNQIALKTSLPSTSKTVDVLQKKPTASFLAPKATTNFLSSITSKEAPAITPSENIEQITPAIVVSKNEKIKNHLEDALAKPYLIDPGLPKPKSSNVNMAPLEQHSKRRELINILEKSIAKGDERSAADAAAKLAQLRLSCSVLSFSSNIVRENTAPSSVTNPNSTNTPQTDELPINANVTGKSPAKIDTGTQSIATGAPVENKQNLAKTVVTKPIACEKNPIKNASITDDSKPSTSRQEHESKLVSIKVWVEDRVAARGPVLLQLPRHAVMGELRRAAEATLGLASHLQRWIVGRALCTDDNATLASLAGPELSSPFYLCLVESDNSKTQHHIQESASNADHSKADAGAVYTELMQLEQRSIITNAEAFECEICMDHCAEGGGAVLRECAHSFCKSCLADVVRHSGEPVVSCPAAECNGFVQEREVRALVPPHEYEKWLARGLAAAESGTRHSFHCRTPDCAGWALCEPGVRRFPCPVCKHINCVPCQAIHESETCEGHRAKLKEAERAIEADETDEGTRRLFESLISKGEALECPECRAMITKKWGCDWVKCFACKTEICWVTRGRRWGPGGRGDTSGGCRCGVDGKRCHPSCGYCH